MKVLCDYCGEIAPLVTGKEVYPHRPDLYSKIFYMCVSCDAFVGCHPQTDKPLGRLADSKLRKAKISAHAAFDPLWKSGGYKRGQLYGWLSNQLGIDKKDCHIGMFDIDTCLRVVEICKTTKPEIRL